MAMTFLKKVEKLDKLKSVKYHLHATWGITSPTGRRTVHASEVTKEDELCPREYALTDLTKKKPARHYLSTSENVTYTMGRVLQDSWSNWFADMGKAICHWKCMGCGNCTSSRAGRSSARAATFSAFKPVEVRFQSALSRAFRAASTCWLPWARRSSGRSRSRPWRDQFKTLVAPLAEHKLRTNLLSADHRRVRPLRGRRWSAASGRPVLYISKSALWLLGRHAEEVGPEGELLALQGVRRHARRQAMTEALIGPPRSSKLGVTARLVCRKAYASSSLAKRAKFCPQRQRVSPASIRQSYDWKGAHDVRRKTVVLTTVNARMLGAQHLFQAKITEFSALASWGRSARPPICATCCMLNWTPSRRCGGGISCDEELDRPMMTTSLGIDLSTKATGLVLLEERMARRRRYCWKTEVKAPDSSWAAKRAIVQTIMELITSVSLIVSCWRATA